MSGCRGRSGLRDLVLVVGEHEVDAAAVDVERLAEDRLRPSPSIRYASPGGPGSMPSGDGQAGSPGFDGFHSTKSIGSRL